MNDQPDLFSFQNTPRPYLGGPGGGPSVPRSDARWRGAAQAGVLHGFKSPHAANHSGSAHEPVFHSYPLRSGAKDHTTSLEAADRIERSGVAGIMRLKCFEAICKRPMTAYEVADELGVLPDSTRPRCSELLRQGKIVRTGQRRDGRHILARAA